MYHHLRQQQPHPSTIRFTWAQHRKTDQANIGTHYTYDGLGRLTTVTDTQGNITRYTYVEVGNKLSQIDAEQPPRVPVAKAAVKRRCLLND